MDTKSVVVSPPYSLVVVLDPNVGVIPHTMAGALIASTNSCVAVGCRAEIDGNTRIILGSEQSVNPGYQPVFEGEIETPSRILEIQSVVGTTLLRALLQDQRTHISIWVNDDKEPDEITVGIRAKYPDSP